VKFEHGAQSAVTHEKGGVVVEKLARFSITVPQDVLEEFDQKLQFCGKYNRSDVLRQLMRSHISDECWRRETGEVYGTVTLKYNHHEKSLSGITNLQHDHGAVIVCTTHVHVTHDTCLECIVLRGGAPEVKTFVNELERVKNIQSLHVVIMAA
jgi:CopG family nickel-responsive transcriptional regulator